LKKEKGSITIEATLALSIFTFAFMTFISFVNVARTESVVQHALNQTAQEISQYFYLLEIIEESENTSQADELLRNFADFSASIGEGFSTSIVHQLFSMDEASLSSSLMQKYLSRDQLHDLGVEGIDLSDSSFLQDGQMINLVAVYRIKSMIPSFFNKHMVIKQTASTAAWVGVEDRLLTKWHLPPLQRGKAFLAEIRIANPIISVRPGIGITLYDNGRCISYYTINIFSATYFQNQLKTNHIKSVLAQYVKNSIQDRESLGEKIQMNNGDTVNITKHTKETIVHLIAPEEASWYYEELKVIARQLEQEYQVMIEWSFLEKALD